VIDLRFDAPIVPVGKARPRATLRWRGFENGQPIVRVKPFPGAKPFAQIYTPARSQAFERKLAEYARTFAPARFFDEPLRVDIDAVARRPRKFSWSTSPSDRIWADHAREDADNIRKAVLDALTGVFWRRDGIVVAGDTQHTYAEKLGEARIALRVQSLAGVVPIDITRPNPELARLHALVDVAFDLSDALEYSSVELVGDPEEIETIERLRDELSNLITADRLAGVPGARPLKLVKKEPR
jgi:Holliday junction resolvase RusA-like endonuclease